MDPLALLVTAQQALPDGEASGYVAAAYLVFLALILIYVAIMASKLGRIQDQIAELLELAERRRVGSEEIAEELERQAAPR
ncbi:hypothetical protein HJD18_00815 [Thermoleophilia bacterium SCSIO 60948]|nr:hypothetical protein HJD18_00815 [Thermoleophilia bacterium SCSIO 60948]